MDINFTVPPARQMVEGILAFQKQGESPFWSDPLYHFYPQLQKEYAEKLPFAQRMAYLEETFCALYEQLSDTLHQKAAQYADHWRTCRPQVEAAFSEAFETDHRTCLNDLCCHVSLDPISPRFLQQRCFEVFYLNSARGAIGASLHELVHFAWFEVWHRVFGDSYEEYERPSLKWILSEMVVEPILRDERLASINPYFPREEGGCVYPYFFDMKVENAFVLDTLDEMYRQMPIQTFMKASYAYCQAHEAAIRRHIQQAEG